MILVLLTHFNNNPFFTLFTDEVPVLQVENNALIVAFSIGVIMMVGAVIAVHMYRRQKGNQTLNSLGIQ